MRLRFFYNDAYRHMTLGVKHPRRSHRAHRARRIIGAHQAITICVTNQSCAQAVGSRSFSDKYAAWRALRAEHPPRVPW